jgi:hypothetical protein
MRHHREAEATEKLGNGLSVERLRAGFPGVAALDIFTALMSVAGLYACWFSTTSAPKARKIR